jgi:hypothetical protein
MSTPPRLETVGLVTRFTIPFKRLTTPTVASEGGAPLATKPFIYKTPPITKTNPKIPGFAKKQQRLRKTRKVTASELEEIVNTQNQCIFFGFQHLQYLPRSVLLP